jgi:hypothetical protein
MSDELGANIMLNEKSNSTYCTAISGELLSNLAAFI